VFLVLAHERRRVAHFNVTAHPTAEWTAQQLREAFPFDLLRDRDKIFGNDFRQQVRDMKIREVLAAPRSPWQRAYVERVIGSVRRECLDHVIVFNEGSLRRILASYFSYYHETRPHLSFGEGLAGVAAGSAAGIGKHSGNRSGWRTAPSLRTPRSLKSHSVQSTSHRALAGCAHVRAPGVGLLLAEVLLRFGAAVLGWAHSVRQPTERQFLICGTHK